EPRKIRNRMRLSVRDEPLRTFHAFFAALVDAFSTFRVVTLRVDCIQDCPGLGPMVRVEFGFGNVELPRADKWICHTHLLKASIAALGLWSPEDFVKIRLRFMDSGGQYRFGEFLLDISERRLFKGTQAVPLEPKTLDVLIALVRRAGRLANKRELLD